MKLRTLIFAVSLALSGAATATPFWGATAPVPFETPPMR